MADSTPDDEFVVRPFASVIREIQAGRTHDELSQKLHDLVTAVNDTGKKGSITLKIDVSKMKGNTAMLLITDTVAVKMPAADRPESVFYADRDGNLSRKDPQQMEFSDLQSVPDTKNDDVQEVAR